MREQFTDLELQFKRRQAFVFLARSCLGTHRIIVKTPNSSAYSALASLPPYCLSHDSMHERLNSLVFVFKPDSFQREIHRPSACQLIQSLEVCVTFAIELAKQGLALANFGLDCVFQTEDRLKICPLFMRFCDDQKATWIAFRNFVRTHRSRLPPEIDSVLKTKQLSMLLLQLSQAKRRLSQGRAQSPSYEIRNVKLRLKACLSGNSPISISSRASRLKFRPMPTRTLRNHSYFNTRTDSSVLNLKARDLSKLSHTQEKEKTERSNEWEFRLKRLQLRIDEAQNRTSRQQPKLQLRYNEAQNRTNKQQPKKQLKLVSNVCHVRVSQARTRKEVEVQCDSEVQRLSQSVVLKHNVDESDIEVVELKPKTSHRRLQQQRATKLQKAPDLASGKKQTKQTKPQATAREKQNKYSDSSLEARRWIGVEKSRIDILGTAVGLCHKQLKRFRMGWQVFAFLLYQEFYAKRRDIQQMLVGRRNVHGLQRFKQFCQSEEYSKLLSILVSENKQIQKSLAKLKAKAKVAVPLLFYSPDERKLLHECFDKKQNEQCKLFLYYEGDALLKFVEARKGQESLALLSIVICESMLEVLFRSVSEFDVRQYERAVRDLDLNYLERRLRLLRSQGDRQYYEE